MELRIERQEPQASPAVPVRSQCSAGREDQRVRGKGKPFAARNVHRPFMLAFAFFVYSLALLNAQNLVNNPGFEDYSVPPDDYGQICRATGWTSPSGACSLIPGSGTPEYYNTAGSAGTRPPATFYANLMPHSGGGMASIVPWYSSYDFREYVQTFLTVPLVVGETYEVGFWLNNAESSFHPYGVDHIGVAFSTAPLVQVLGNRIAYVPQIELPGVVFSTTWQFHTMTFTAAQPYQYICFGSFVPYAAITYQDFGGTYDWGSLYYIDDVSVQALTPLPVELLDFRAECEGSSEMLQWHTASESNCDRFEVERSLDLQQWKMIGTLPCAGNSQQARGYSFADPETFNTTVYYRLKQVDRDGAYTYHSVVPVSACSDEILLNQWLLDTSGRVLGPWPVADGQLAFGVYFVRSEFSNGRSSVRKVVVTEGR